jgi:uncharacterized protein (DUF305 family)
VIVPALLAAVASAACSGAPTPAGEAPRPGTAPAASAPRPQPYSPADVHFMAGMIPHHAQAILIAGWAPTHGAGSAVRILAERIVVGQRDEIETLQEWLRDRGENVPAADATHLRTTMDGVEHDMLMPGMLTADELAQLDRARGTEFDRLFLTFMIRHHEGAMAMVEQLFASYGAAQDDVVFKFASDVFADQGSEIDRMQKMLAELSSGGGGERALERPSPRR